MNLSGRLFCICLSLMILSACEAPLLLEKVEAEKNKYVHRTDAFQASASNKDVIIVVGSYGVILSSSDQGDNWSRTQLEHNANLIDIVACKDNTFVALSIEGDVWVSQDDGANWKTHKIETEEVPQAITCDHGNRIWVVGSFGTIFHSDDKGLTWVNHSLEEDMILTSVFFHDERQGVITGEFGTVLETVDAGESWQTKTLIPDEFIPLDTYFSDYQHGWVVGLSGVIYHTNDGANSWVKESSGTKVPLFTVTKIGSDIYAAGESGVAVKRVASTDDTEVKWQAVSFENPVRSYLRVLQMITTDKLLIGGGGFVRIIETNTSSNDARS